MRTTKRFFASRRPREVAYTRKRMSVARTMRLYSQCIVLDVIGAGMREFAFTILILTMVKGPTVGLVTKQGVLALVYLGSLALVRWLRMDCHWRTTAFVANVTMTLLSVIAGGLAAQGSLTYGFILAHAAIAGATSAFSSGPAARLRHVLGGGEQQKLAWTLDANSYFGRVVAGLLCLGVTLLFGTAAGDKLRDSATAFLILDAVFSIPIGWFYFQLVRRRVHENGRTNVPQRARPAIPFRTACIALVRIQRLRSVVVFELLKGLFLSVPFAWQILRFRHRADDSFMALLTIGVAVAGLAGNIVGSRVFERCPALRKPGYRMLAMLMPASLLLASTAGSAFWFVAALMLYMITASPADSLSDAWLVQLPVELAARIAEIRGTFNSTVAPLGRILVSGILLEWLALPAEQALAVLSGVTMIIVSMLSIAYGVRTSRTYQARRRRAPALLPIPVLVRDTALEAK
ncbi:MAG: hypothetical protein U0136_21690 [Bdellovibrionota bacterium]